MENAVKHCVSAVEGRGTVAVRAALRGDLLWIEVFDNGPNFPPGFSLAEAAMRPPDMGCATSPPVCSGIDVAACLPQPRPHVIFCTAYDQHAVDAFELHAVD